MPHDTLQSIIGLRRRAVDAARRALTTAIAAAVSADEVARRAEQAIQQETGLAADPLGDDRLVEAFAAWLPAARQRATQARLWHERQEAEVARCRADLAASRTALESVEQLAAERRIADQADRARREARALDETVTHGLARDG